MNEKRLILFELSNGIMTINKMQEGYKRTVHMGIRQVVSKTSSTCYYFSTTIVNIAKLIVYYVAQDAARDRPHDGNR